MRTTKSVVLIFLCFISASYAQVKIGTNPTNIHPSAALEIESSNKGLLIPRLTSNERTAISNPANGLMVYQTDGVAGVYTYNSNAWQALGAAGTNGTNGVDGKTVLNGTSNPTAAIGANGDFFINTTANTLFGPKAAGAWPTGVSLVGPQGANGSNGAAGTNGYNSLVKSTTETAGANCATGGVKLEFGLDANSNGSLEAGEVTTALTRYVCNGATGASGNDGATGATGAAGQGVPTGGTANQVLAKVDGTNYNTQWVTPSAGGSSDNLGNHTATQALDMNNQNITNVNNLNANFLILPSITYPITTANNTSVNLTGTINASVIKFTSSTNFSVQGLPGGIQGKIVYLYNTSAFNMTVTNNGPSETSTSVLKTWNIEGGTNVVTTGPGIITLMYDTSVNSGNGGWIIIGKVL